MKADKMRRTPLKYYEPLISGIFLLLLFLSPILFGNFEYGLNWNRVFRSWQSFIPYLILFLVNRFIFLPFLFFRKKQWLFFVCNLVLIAVMTFGVHYYRTRILMPGPAEDRNELNDLPPPGRLHRPAEGLPAPGRPFPPDRELTAPPDSESSTAQDAEDRSLQDGGDMLRGPKGPGPRPVQPPKQLPPFVSFLMVSILVVGFDTGLQISVRWAKAEQRRVQAEKDNMESQLAFLQNQVSPHFFMNTLNNIHALIDIDTGEAKESIIKLSKLMRHLLYDSQVEKIPLKKEIEFIQHYVELMRLRFSERVKINLLLPDQIPDQSIPPLLFTSFVENAFKHGVSYQADSFIDMRFSYSGNRLDFVIRNSNPGNEKQEGPSGIGVENARKRLDLLYGEAYILKIYNREEDFSVHLSIPV